MRCTHVLKGGHFACRQCRSCRINAQRVWTLRILMEAKKHEHTSFLTLTYDDEHLPLNATLSPDHLTTFLKRLRYYRKAPFRYFAVGEYGDNTFRPHYHAALFGVPASDLPQIHAAWTKCAPSRATLTPLIPERAAYLGGYCSKKMTKHDDLRLNGRHPEFARMSRMGDGGIGASAMDDIASMLLTDRHAKDFLQQEGDVPTALKTEGRLLPLGSYLRSKLREKTFPDSPAWFHTFDASITKENRFYETMQAVREGALTLAEADKKLGFIRNPEEVDQRVRTAVAKQQITKIGRKL